MSILQKLYTYWSGNATLTGAIPTTSVSLDLVPDSVVYPFARLTVVSNMVTHTTGTSDVRECRLQISIFSPDLNRLATIADTVDGQFDRQSLFTGCMACLQDNRIQQQENLAGLPVYHEMLEYWIQYNSTAGTS